MDRKLNIILCYKSKTQKKGVIYTKKRIGLTLCVFLWIAAISGCTSPSESQKSYVDAAEIANVYASPNNYKGKYIELTGEVFTDPEKGSASVSFQMFHDVENSEQNTVVICHDASLEVKIGDFVKVDAKIDGSFSGTNAFGGEVSALQVTADTVEISSYAEIIAPAIKTIEPADAIKDQHGCVVEVTKIEIAENETRVYVTATNNSDKEMTLYSSNAKLLQGSKQIEETYNFDADYEEVQSEILPGMSSSGIILFDRIDPDTAFQVYIEAHNDNYRLDFEPYTFDISIAE